MIFIYLLISLVLDSSVKTYRYLNTDFIVVQSDLKDNALKLFWKDSSGKPFKTIYNLKKSLEEKNVNVTALMNGGIYSKQNKPLGFCKINGKVLSKLNEAKNAGGNFSMQPNGLFVFNDTQANILETAVFKKEHAQWKNAIQSGPLLILNKKINSKFNKDSKSKYIRNAVAIDDEGVVSFVLSKKPVNFYNFSSFCLNELGAKNALYLDGNISGMSVPEINYYKDWFYVTMIGLVKR